MISIDVSLKLSPVTITVQRKEMSDAEALYQNLTRALSSPTAELIELTCEKQTEKKVALMSDQISAVILSQKDGGANAGRVPGFAALGQTV
jgi:hypothetical protein